MPAQATGGMPRCHWTFVTTTDRAYCELCTWLSDSFTLSSSRLQISGAIVSNEEPLHCKMPSLAPAPFRSE
jgi:hypothetical protein